MDKVFKALDNLESCAEGIDVRNCYDIVYQALLELKSIKETKPSEVLEDFRVIKLKTINAGYDYGYKVWDKIEQALLELQAIKNAKPSEAMDYLYQFIDEMTRCLENPKQYAKNYDKEIFYKYKHTLETTIKQALLKAEKLEKALETIKKNVKVGIDYGDNRDFSIALVCYIDNDKKVYIVDQATKETSPEHFEELENLKEMLR